MGVIAYVIARPGLDSAASIVSFFGVVYVLERGAVELWKTFLRNEDQSKYFIPMQFAVFGNVVQSQSRRYIIGVIITTAVCGTFLVVHYGAPRLSLQDHIWMVFAIATISGWISAFLGAWKDAPVEGFQPLKFVAARSGQALGPAVGALQLSILVVMMAGLAYDLHARAYKTFFFPSKPRGKFAASPFCSRTCFADVSRSSLYAAIWLFVLWVSGWRSLVPTRPRSIL